MALWNYAAVAATLLAAARCDEYDIPAVGAGRRAQYHVLHADGSFKYGYDTGDGAFESLKTASDGEAKGRFGFTNPDGEDVRLEYTSGSGGFVATGSHIPQVHPDVVRAFAQARAAGPFVDPLADAEGDRSYDFKFDGEEHSRSEVSNSDGTVTGSYSYIDEFGNTKHFTYRAGKGIGFVIEGDGLDSPGKPLPTHSRTTQFGASHSSRASAARTTAPRRKVSRAKPAQRVQSAHTRTSSQRKQSSHFGTSAHKTRKNKVYFSPTKTTSTSSTSVSRPSTRHGHHHTSVSSSSSSSFSSGRPLSSTGVRTSTKSRKFEAANTRASLSPAGGYSVAYETSSHTRQQSADDDNNVKGSFSFVAEDDGSQHDLSFEAGSDTGYVVSSGTSLPVGPIVPGSPTGEPNGKLERVSQTPFVDPLADGDLDASYTFKFESDGYSRTETADEDGNVSGTYSVLGEDNVLRTYRFRAGKGIGFETEEINAKTVSPSTRTSTKTSSSSSSSSSTRRTGGGVRQGGTSGVVAHTRQSTKQGSARPSQQFLTPTRSAASSSSSRHHQQSTRTSSTSNRQQQSSRASGHSGSHGASRRTSHKQRTHHQGNSLSEGFQLRQYHPSEGRGKYGYVIKYDD